MGHIQPGDLIANAIRPPGFFRFGGAMNENNTTRAVAAIARGSENLVGFDPTLIISALIPVLLNCFAKDQNDESPKEFLQAHYDEETDTFDWQLIERCRPQTRRAARAEGQRRLSRDQLDAITRRTLSHALTMPDEDVEAVAIEAGIQLK